MPTSKAKKIVTWSIIIVFVLAFFTIKTFFVGYYRIPQNGMYPTLPTGSIFFTAKHPYSDSSRVKRGDIIVFVREQNGQRYNYIWRVVALPGDKVEASSEALAINGRQVQRERIGDTGGKTIFREHIGNVSYQIAIDPSSPNHPPDASLTVPPDEFFVMGDNRLNAFDSRNFGPISFSSIIGKKCDAKRPNQSLQPTADRRTERLKDEL